MRTDQYMGLNEWAQNFVRGEQVFAYTERVVRVYPDGRESAQPDRRVSECTVKCTKIGEIAGAWDPVVADLHEYTLPNGRVYREKVQAEPWSSGPCYFVALVDETDAWVPESLWTDEETGDG